ncbi:MAG: hypothetical protein WAS54_10830 [Scrofimicrobium sp.]
MLDSSAHGRREAGLPLTYTGTLTYRGPRGEDEPYTDPIVLDYEQFEERVYSKTTTLQQVETQLKQIHASIRGISDRPRTEHQQLTKAQQAQLTMQKRQLRRQSARFSVRR